MKAQHLAPLWIIVMFVHIYQRITHCVIIPPLEQVPVSYPTYVRSVYAILMLCNPKNPCNCAHVLDPRMMMDMGLNK